MSLNLACLHKFLICFKHTVASLGTLLAQADIFLSVNTKSLYVSVLVRVQEVLIDLNSSPQRISGESSSPSSMGPGHMVTGWGELQVWLQLLGVTVGRPGWAEEPPAVPTAGRRWPGRKPPCLGLIHSPGLEGGRDEQRFRNWISPLPSSPVGCTAWRSVPCSAVVL